MLTLVVKRFVGAVLMPADAILELALLFVSSFFLLVLLLLKLECVLVLVLFWLVVFCLRAELSMNL